MNMDALTLRQTKVQTQVNSFVRSVYNWMSVGLALTGLIAYAVANMPAVRDIIFGSTAGSRPPRCSNAVGKVGLHG
jgi:uncharacterized protein